jgi:hypothetical protein
MVKNILLIIVCFFYLPAVAQRTNYRISADLLVVGGGTGGVAAGLQAARMGIKTIIVEPTTMLGGMLTAAAVSCTDGNDGLRGGMWEEFRQQLYKHYGTNKLNSGWVSETCFEPHVADSIFKMWVANEKNLSVFYGYTPKLVIKYGNKIKGVNFSGKTNTSFLEINAKVTIDATELGDILAMAGAGYDLGMEDKRMTGETEALEKNNIIQDITWSAILRDYGPGADKTIVKPEGYQREAYYCCNTDAPCDDTPWNGDKLKMLGYAKLPNKKYMLNWPIHGNDYYLNVVEKNDNEREKGYALVKNKTLGFIYFLQTDLGMSNIGPADDEVDHGLALIPYNREGRRVKGMVRLTINHIKEPYKYNLYRTGISVGDYPVDHHHGQYPGKVPAIEFPPIPSFNVPLGTLIPAKTEGLIVCEKAISVTNIVNGTTRLQPVVLLTGQAAGILAALAIRDKQAIKKIPVRKVQDQLLKSGCYIVPFADVQPEDPHWSAVQRTGVTGILRGIGKAEAWANKTYFYPDTIVPIREFVNNLKQYSYYCQRLSKDESLLYSGNDKSELLTFDQLESILWRLRKELWNVQRADEREWRKELRLFVSEEFNKDFTAANLMTKKEVSVIVDRYLGTFYRIPIDLNGNPLAGYRGNKKK